MRCIGAHKPNLHHVCTSQRNGLSPRHTAMPLRVTGTPSPLQTALYPNNTRRAPNSLNLGFGIPPPPPLVTPPPPPLL